MQRRGEHCRAVRAVSCDTFDGQPVYLARFCLCLRLDTAEVSDVGCLHRGFPTSQRVQARSRNALKLNSLPFNSTGEVTQNDGLWRVYEFTWQMDAILFWDRFEGRWLRGTEFCLG